MISVGKYHVALLDSFSKIVPLLIYDEPDLAHNEGSVKSTICSNNSAVLPVQQFGQYFIAVDAAWGVAARNVEPAALVIK